MRLRKFTVKGLPSLSSCFFFVARKTMQIPSSYSVKMATFFEKITKSPRGGDSTPDPIYETQRNFSFGVNPSILAKSWLRACQQFYFTTRTTATKLLDFVATCKRQ